MLRSLLKQSRKTFDLSALTANGYCTRVLIPPRRRNEENDVRLLGTLISDSFLLPSGTKSLTIKTNDSEKNYTMHRINVRIDSDYTAGQRLYVAGELVSNSKVVDERKINTAIIRARSLYVMDNNSGSSSASKGDQNIIEMIANVSSDIFESSSEVSFSVATHFYVLNDNGGHDERTNFHRIRVFDHAARDYVVNNIRRSDRIHLNGRLGSNALLSDDGKRHFNTFIVTNNVTKVGKRRQSELEEVTSADELA